MRIKQPFYDRFCKFALLACVVFQIVMWTVAFKFYNSENGRIWIVDGFVILGIVYNILRAHFPFTPKFLNKPEVNEENWIFYSRMHLFSAAEISFMGISMTLIPTDFAHTMVCISLFVGSLIASGVCLLYFKAKGYFGTAKL